MSSLSAFLKGNKKEKANKKYAVTGSICDEKGETVEWEFRHITTKEDGTIRDLCTEEVQIKGKPNAFRPRLNVNKYLTKMICRSAVFPDLNNSELQDSYGVKTPEDLLYELVDDPGEYQNLCEWIQRFQGFEPLQKKVNDAKN
ncbi:MAG: hypothetical protein HFG35_12205 [Eubacterium sp.]|jgi:hypothetical protein|nr:hypothetical protein [Eubacterium sp.]